MYLSKSIYVSVWNCPKGAWIRKYHPEWVTVSEDQQARFDTGHEVGEIARGMTGLQREESRCFSLSCRIYINTSENALIHLIQSGLKEWELFSTDRRQAALSCQYPFMISPSRSY